MGEGDSPMAADPMPVPKAVAVTIKLFPESIDKAWETAALNYRNQESF